MTDPKVIISQRAAKFLNDGDVVNLGIGLPEMIANHLPADVEIYFQSENGILGMGAAAVEGEEIFNVSNAGGKHVTTIPGASFFDSATSFGLVRGGHVDKTFLGALQVDEEGSLASHIIPGKMVPGMGGAMDLVAGAKKVIIVTTHAAKGDAPKILKKCTLPLTAYKKVDFIITELAVIEVTPAGLKLLEISNDTTLERVKELTGATLIIPEVIGKF